MAEGTPTSGESGGGSGVGWVRMPDGKLVSLDSGLIAEISGTTLQFKTGATVMASYDYGDAGLAEQGRAALETQTAALPLPDPGTAPPALAVPTLVSIDPVSGDIGEDVLVTVAGTNLAEGGVLTLDGIVTGATTWVDAETMTVMVAAETLEVGDHDVEYTGPDEQEATLPDGYEVTEV